ncbi:MAG: hypothetical protein Q6367_001845 [Candidatus Freyarchaeota archaeon]
MDVERARNLIKELFMKHAVEGDKGYWSAFYKKDEIIKIFTENGYTKEEARKLLEENEVMLPYFKGEEYYEPETPENTEPTIITVYTIMDECDLAEYYYEDYPYKLGEMYDEDPQKYIMGGTFNIADRTERIIRAIYAKKKTRFLTKHTLISKLMDREICTGEEAEEIIEKYRNRQVLSRDSRLVDMKQYKLLNSEESAASLAYAFQMANDYRGDGTGFWLDEDVLIYLIIEQNITEEDAEEIIERSGEFLETRTKTVSKEVYMINRMEDLLVDWALDCKIDQETMGEGEMGSPQATRNVQYKDIREIFKQAYQQGRKTLTYREIIQKIQEKCGVSREEAGKAFWNALQTFKITPEFEKNVDKKWIEKEYWWSGTSDHHPPRPAEKLDNEEEDEHEE